ncbi:MAG: TetR/AcrR family transcriptional regulator [Anaerolineae bacterium]|nr:TetR/AcrR family transcriptional regulator [Anaerolineae bacterium]
MSTLELFGMNDLTLTILNPDLPRAERCDAQANRVRILQAAEQLFAERGVAAVAMADIGKAAGVGQGTLYRRFANKGELCLALMDHQMTQFQDHVLTEMGRMTRDGAAKLAQLQWFLDAHLHFNEKHTALLCEASQSIYFAPSMRPPPYVWQHMTVLGLLRGAIAAAEMPDSDDLPVLADAIMALIHPSIFRLMRDGNGYTPERISATLQSLVRRLGG